LKSIGLIGLTEKGLLLIEFSGLIGFTGFIVFIGLIGFIGLFEMIWLDSSCFKWFDEHTEKGLFDWIESDWIKSDWIGFNLTIWINWTCWIAGLDQIEWVGVIWIHWIVWIDLMNQQ
jgi:hypothetical protein